jgi:hypothetical protein
VLGAIQTVPVIPESEFSKRETKNRLLCADIAIDQSKPFNTEVSPKKKSSEAATEQE